MTAPRALDQLAQLLYANEFIPAHDPNNLPRTPPARSYRQAQAIIDAGWQPPPPEQENYPHYPCQATGCPECNWTGGEPNNPIPFLHN